MPNFSRSGGVTGESARARRNREAREANPRPRTAPAERGVVAADVETVPSGNYTSGWSFNSAAGSRYDYGFFESLMAHQTETLTQSVQTVEDSAAEPEVVEANNQADDENFALEAEPVIEQASIATGQFSAPEPIIPQPPEDPMIPHESDTSSIHTFRSVVQAGVRPGINEATLIEYTNLLGTLTASARANWVRNGGSIHPPQRSTGFTPPPSWRSGTIRPRRRSQENNQTFFGNIPETSTMTTVASHFGMRVNYPSIEKHPLIVGTHLAGVEIELENITRETPNFRYWTAKSDGSLRNNGMEFVCSHPWGGADLYNAAVEIDGFLFNDGNAPEGTWRCSTHVHIDVRDMTAAQVKKMILAYVFYERVLFKCSGWHRYKNNFCVALGFAQGQLEDLGNWWAQSDENFLHNLSQRWDKYTAINFLPMGSFGSIEFRISEAKWHKGQLIRLTNRFLSLKEVAMANTSMSDEQFLQFLMQSDPADIIKKGIPKGIGPVQDDLEVGFKLAHDILSLAKLRRRSRRMFVPDFEDGSRIVETPAGEIFMNGWNHCRSHLTDRYPSLEFPRDCGTRFTFNWLYELYTMMRRHRLTFEVQWFLPQQNRSQLIRLWEQYLNSRRSEQAEEAPQAAPQPARRQEWFEDDEDSDEEPDSDEVEW